MLRANTGFPSSVKQRLETIQPEASVLLHAPYITLPQSRRRRTYCIHCIPSSISSSSPISARIMHLARAHAFRSALTARYNSQEHIPRARMTTRGGTSNPAQPEEKRTRAQTHTQRRSAEEEEEEEENGSG